MIWFTSFCFFLFLVRHSECNLRATSNPYSTFDGGDYVNGCYDLHSCCNLALTCSVDLMYWSTSGNTNVQNNLFDGMESVSGVRFRSGDNYTGVWEDLGDIDEVTLTHCPHPICPQNFEYISGTTDRCVYKPRLGSQGSHLFQPPFRNLADCLESESNSKTDNPGFGYYQSGSYCLSYYEQAQKDCLFFISLRDSSPCDDYDDSDCSAVETLDDDLSAG